MDILIGKQGNQPFQLTESSISRQHAILHVDKPTGKMILKDINSTNGTWILTKDGVFKRLVGETPVSPETLVRLGAKHTFRIKELLKPKEQEAVDISDIKGVYEAYTKNKMALEAKTSNIMMWRMASLSLGSILGLVLSVALPDEIAGNQVASIFVKALGIVLSIGISWMIVDRMNKNLISRKDQNENYFKKKYCCPKCGYHFGFKVYQNIIAEGRCPNSNCKCRFVGR